MHCRPASGRELTPSDSEHLARREEDTATLYLTTGLHPDRHLPSDTAERIDYGQIESTVWLVLELLTHLDPSSLGTDR